MPCRHARRAIRSRLDQGLAIEREFELDLHLEQCEHCRAFAERAALLEEALARLPEPPVERLDVERSVQVIRGRFTATERVGKETGSRRRPWRKTASIAAAVLLLVGAAVTIALWRGSAEQHFAGKEGGNRATETHGLPEEAVDPPVALAAGEAPLDRELLARKREEVRQHLLRCAGRLAGDAGREDVLAFAELFDVDTIGLRRDEWPVRRIVEGMLDGEDLEAAGAAARYLGVRGDSLAARQLTRALERPELAEAATRALCDLGAGGKEGLVIALGRPGLRAVALDGVENIGGGQAAAILSQALIEQRLGRERGQAPDEDLLTALCDLGIDAVETLIELGERGVLERDELLAALDDAPGAAAFFAGQGEIADASDLAIVATARFAPDLALAWFEDHLHDRRRRDLARAELPRVAGERTVAALVRLHSDSRLGAEVYQELVREALERDAGRFVSYCETSIANGRDDELVTLAELLLASDSGRAVVAVSLLSRQEQLEASLRQTLVLAVGDRGGAHEVATLLELYDTLGADDRHLAAACVLSLSKLGGDEACGVALEGAARRSTQNILSLLNRRKAGERTYPSIYRLARELKPILEDRDRENWRTSS